VYAKAKHNKQKGVAIISWSWSVYFNCANFSKWYFVPSWAAYRVSTVFQKGSPLWFSP